MNTVTETPAVDQYDFWRRRLKGEVVPIHDGECQAGFYRDGARAVAIWFKDGALRCRVNGHDIEANDAMERWPFISKRPVSHEDYTAKIETGNWPGESALVTQSNNAPEDNSFEGIQAQIEEMAREADRLMKLGPAKSKAQADEASDVADKLGKLFTKADNARKVEKQPHADAAAGVDDKWRPLTTAASIYKRLKDAVVEPFLKAQKAAKDKAEREAREAAEKAQREAAQKIADAKRAEEEALRSGDTQAAEKAKADADIATQRATEADTAANTIAATPITAGTRGRKTSLRSVTVVTIEDRAAVLEFFKDRQELSELLQDMADKAVKAGFTVPGTKVSKDQDAA